MQQFISFKNTKLYFSVVGSGDPILLLHGFLENATMWNGITEALSSSNTVITIDLLGHGKSAGLDEILTMDIQAAAVKSVLDFLNFDRVVVVGHSMGGYVALAMLEQYSDVFSKICLMNSTAKEDSEERKELRLRAVGLAETNYKSLVKMSISNLFVKDSYELFADEIDEVKNQASLITKENYCAATRGMRLRPDSESILLNASIPKLYIIGAKDPIILPKDVVEEAARTKATYKILDSGHMSHIESKEELIVILKNFVG